MAPMATMITKRMSNQRTTEAVLLLLARLGAGTVPPGGDDGGRGVGPGRTGSGRPATGFIAVCGSLAGGAAAIHHGVMLAVPACAGASGLAAASLAAA